MRKILIALALAVSMTVALATPALAHVCVGDGATTGAENAAVDLNVGAVGGAHPGNTNHTPDEAHNPQKG